MLKLLLNLPDQFFPLPVDSILGVEEFSTFCIAAALKITKLFLVGKLVLQ